MGFDFNSKSLSIFIPSECTDGQFGPGCINQCNCVDPCDKVTGQCPTECEDGWMGADCQQSKY